MEGQRPGEGATDLKNGEREALVTDTAPRVGGLQSCEGPRLWRARVLVEGEVCHLPCASPWVLGAGGQMTPL